MGSSPRMRGTHRFDSVGHYPAGIIPAYAGNTSTSSMVTVRPPDHPRVCGEHSGVSAPSAVRAGSSPRMRGTRFNQKTPFILEGIIPAYAGNTVGMRSKNAYTLDHPRVCGEHSNCPTWSLKHFGDHPRVCGEHKRLPRTRTTRLGSSPRMRGTPHDVDHGTP